MGFVRGGLLGYLIFPYSLVCFFFFFCFFFFVFFFFFFFREELLKTKIFGEKERGW